MRARLRATRQGPGSLRQVRQGGHERAHGVLQPQRLAPGPKVHLKLLWPLTADDDAGHW